MQLSKIIEEVKYQSRLFLAVLMMSALLVGATIAIIEPKQKIDAVLILQVIVTLAVLIQIVFGLISKANYSVEQPIRSELCDEYANKYNLNRDRVMAFAKLNRTAEGRNTCIAEDFEYAVRVINRIDEQKQGV